MGQNYHLCTGPNTNVVKYLKAGKVEDLLKVTKGNVVHIFPKNDAEETKDRSCAGMLPIVNKNMEIVGFTLEEVCKYTGVKKDGFEDMVKNIKQK